MIIFIKQTYKVEPDLIPGLDRATIRFSENLITS